MHKGARRLFPRPAGNKELIQFYVVKQITNSLHLGGCLTTLLKIG